MDALLCDNTNGTRPLALAPGWAHGRETGRSVQEVCQQKIHVDLPLGLRLLLLRAPGRGLEVKARPASVAAGGLTLAPAPSSCDALRLVPADARRFSLSFLSGPSSSFSIVRTSVSMRRFSLAAQRRAFSRRGQPVAGLRRGALERRPRLQEPVEPEQRFGANVVLQLFPLAPA